MAEAGDHMMAPASRTGARRAGAPADTEAVAVAAAGPAGVADSPVGCTGPVVRTPAVAAWVEAVTGCDRRSPEARKI